MKDSTKRPDIDEIIFSDVFQAKAQINGITLPPMLDKSKLQQKYSNEQPKIELIDKQRKLDPKGMEKSTSKINKTSN